MNDSFKPGQEWLDTEGKKIHAHGGSLIQVGDVFYWYGENKEKTDGVNGIWHWGVRCYASRDLYNWEDCGIIIPPDIENQNSPLHPSSSMDRPHIIFNEITKRFVCWIKVMKKDGTQKTTILSSENILGPYIIEKKDLAPLDMSAGDFDLVIAPDGKAYYYFERVHSELICADLTSDYLDVTGYYSTHFPLVEPPYVREAPAYFFREGKHYLVTSGTTGYYPNPSEIARADTWHGPFEVLGDLHPTDPSNTSFHSQISCIFKVPGKKDLYIACADRWLPEMTDIHYNLFRSTVEKYYGINDTPMTNEESKLMKRLKKHKHNTSQSEYVWLPLVFKEDKITIEWRDEWRLEEFEDA